MRKILLYCGLFAILVVSCQKESNPESEIQTSEIENEFNYGGVHFTISNGSPFKVKSTEDDYFTLKAETSEDSIIIVNKTQAISDGVTQYVHYDFEGKEMAIGTVINGKLVNIEINSEYFNMTKGRKNGESYKECVGRTYRWAKETIEEDDFWGVVCDAPVASDACYASEVAFSALSCIGKEK